jgi:hypothetical protein
MTTVVCAECRHENEPERVYCHGCGARLDRSAVKVSKYDVKDAQKRVKKFFDPQRAKMRALFFKVSKVVLSACAVAGLIQLALPPDVPAASKMEVLASQVRMDLEGAATRHVPPQLQYTDDQVNGFLVYALKSKQKALDLPTLDFKRAVVAFREGNCAVTAERSFFGYSVYTTCLYAPAGAPGKLGVVSRGGYIGRMPVHPQIAQYMAVLLSDVFKALDREIKLVSKFGTAEVHDKNIVLTAAQ